MSEMTYAVGDKVTILDVNKQGEVTAVSEDGTQITVKYVDDAGVEATETGAAEKFAPVGEDAGDTLAAPKTEESEQEESESSEESSEEGSESAE
jgi:hypothetical protein